MNYNDERRLDYEHEKYETGRLIVVVIEAQVLMLRGRLWIWIGYGRDLFEVDRV